MQEALTRVLGVYGSRPRPFHDFTHFANTVTKTAVNWLRDQRRQARGLTSAFDEEPIAFVADPRPDVVVRALAQLETSDRLLITEGVINGLSLDELAERFLTPDERSANARRLCVRRRLHEAIARLRALYAATDTE
ncbi:hypothetical protein FTUN_4838 [Frigoriglobus tundricola]|uniref:Uncharacterized protein n=2 Tax=Frigoriglobus tundricola TaxID=2774151 RepID=A0A6M5YTD7_9BACT|nr:hypothetical protein FTUN_4838 [Frigoriglobus tundricola]